jgi:hypothetical protein
MASNSGIFFSAQVMLLIQAVATRSIIFDDFPEMTALRSSLPDISVSEIESSQGSRSNLTLPGSITRRVNDLSINDSPLHRVRMTRRPPINIDDIISRVDNVGRSTAECIELAETALHRPHNSACRIPLRLCNNSAIYLDQILISMENLHVSNLV